MLCVDTRPAPWVILTDAPADFDDLPVQVITHAATGPMAIDYLGKFPPTGNGRGAAAYHDKRFALQATLRNYQTAIFLDADSRVDGPTALPDFPPGLAVLPVVQKTVADHLETCGSWRIPAFARLARELMGSPEALHAARWCHETCYAVTKDGNEPRFFDAWEFAATFMARYGVHSGEGGVMGLAAAYAGWAIDYEVLSDFGRAVRHEGGGPKDD
jgi:hypothetical protein